MSNLAVIEFKEFSVPSISQYRELLENKAVNQHLPLASTAYSDEWIRQWIQRKSLTFAELEKGPWSVWVDGVFAGWAGVEPDQETLSYGIVLLPKFWGTGIAITKAALTKVSKLFPEYSEVEIELPKSRRSERVAARLDLKPTGEKLIAGYRFDTYRLSISGLGT